MYTRLSKVCRNTRFYYNASPGLREATVSQDFLMKVWETVLLLICSLPNPSRIFGPMGIVDFEPKQGHTRNKEMTEEITVKARGSITPTLSRDSGGIAPGRQNILSSQQEYQDPRRKGWGGWGVWGGGWVHPVRVYV